MAEALHPLTLSFLFCKMGQYHSSHRSLLAPHASSLRVSHCYELDSPSASSHWAVGSGKQNPSSPI